MSKEGSIVLCFFPKYFERVDHSVLILMIMNAHQLMSLLLEFSGHMYVYM